MISPFANSYCTSYLVIYLTVPGDIPMYCQSHSSIIYPSQQPTAFTLCPQSSCSIDNKGLFKAMNGGGVGSRWQRSSWIFQAWARAWLKHSAKEVTKIHYISCLNILTQGKAHFSHVNPWDIPVVFIKKPSIYPSLLKTVPTYTCSTCIILKFPLFTPKSFGW